MDLRRILIPLALATALVLGWQAQGWAGVALVGGGIVMWGLLHLTRIVTVLRRAAQRPVGWVGSAVMLHARLHRGQSLLHVLALARSLGQAVDAQGQPLPREPTALPAPTATTEHYRWQDDSGCRLTCTFVHGRLQQWQLQRTPETTPETPPAAPAAAPGSQT